MVATALLYAQAIGLLVALAALGLEQLLALWRWPRRGVWMLALTVSVIAPAALLHQSLQASESITLGAQAHVSAFEVAFKPPFLLLEMRALLSWEVAVTLTVLWVLASSVFVMLNIRTWVRLQAASRDWIPRRLDGERVFVSENEGPAVFGLFRPRIVVPRWLLHADSETRAAAITHEWEHIKRGDGLLSLFGLVLVATMAWNLPLTWQLKRLRLAIEVDCDTRVVCGRHPLDGIAYADALVRIWRRNYPETDTTELSSDMRNRIVVLQAWSTRNH